jgi:hypothetical protein
MPYFLLEDLGDFAIGPSCSSVLNFPSFCFASSAASFTALPMWKSEREPSVAMS